MSEDRDWTIQYVEHVLEKLKLTPTGLAKLASMSSTTLTRPLNNEDYGHRLSLGTVEKIAKVTGIPPDPFMPGDEDGTSAHDPRYRSVKAYDIEASAGHGAIVTEEAPLYEVAFNREMLDTITKASDQELAVIRAKGESMSPTLSDGDMMLVDTTKRNLNYDGIFILRYDDVLRVKRIDKNPQTGKLYVKSDNPLYDAFEVDPERLDVIGRVIWIGRKV